MKDSANDKNGQMQLTNVLLMHNLKGVKQTLTQVDDLRCNDGVPLQLSAKRVKNSYAIWDSECRGTQQILFREGETQRDENNSLGPQFTNKQQHNMEEENLHSFCSFLFFCFIFRSWIFRGSIFAEGRTERREMVASSSLFKNYASF
jgi:hypothetical protein